MGEDQRAQLTRRLEASVGQLGQAATERMKRDLPWFEGLSAEHRATLGLIVQNAIKSFILWFKEPGQHSTVTADIFGVAPQAFARVISLHQTVEVVRTAIDAVERKIPEIVEPADLAVIQPAIARYAREVAFSTAEVYARTAEMRGAWDARLEALVVDAVLRGETDEALRSRAAALGWHADRGQVVVVLGSTPEETEPGAGPSQIDLIRHRAQSFGLDALCAVQGDRLVIILGGVDDPDKSAGYLAEFFGPGPVVVGPMVPDLLAAPVSARSAVAGFRAAPGWPDAPRPVASADLLPERALSGDGHARRQLVTQVYAPLVSGGETNLDTVAAFLESGSSIEATARKLFVHANTVRYRLRRAADITGLNPAEPRDAYTLRLALTLGRLMSPETHPS